MLAGLVTYFGGEINNDPSVTEPNQCLSISEIMARFGMGMNASVLEGAMYDENDDDDFDDDLTRLPDFDFADAKRLQDEIEMQQAMQMHGEGIENHKEKDNDISANDVQTEEKSETKTDSVENS